MNELIENILAGIKDKNDMDVPFSFLEYDGNEETYITYCSIGKSPAQHVDDAVTELYLLYDIDIYSKTNYRKIRKEVYEKMMSAGFMFVEESEDMYEQDTQYHHVTITFKIERSIEEWLTLD